MSRLSLALESLQVSSVPAPRHRAGIPAEPKTPPAGSQGPQGSQGSQGSRLHAETLDWSHLDLGPLLEAIATFGPHSEEERGRPARRGPLGLPVKTPRAPPEGTPRIGAPPRGRPGPSPSHSTPKATASPRGARSLPRSGARDPSPCTLGPKSPRPRAATPAGRVRVAGATQHAGARSDRDDHHQQHHHHHHQHQQHQHHQQREKEEEEEEADEDGLLFQFGSQGRGMGEFMNLQGVALTPSGRIVTADSGKHAVQVFLSTGEFLTQFGVRGRDPGQMVHPSGVAVRANGDLLVTDPETRSLNVYAPDGRHRSQLGVGLLQAPRGVCTTDSGLALVADNKACAVVALTAAGRVHAKFGGRAADLGRLRGPNYVALNSKGDVIVSDFLDHSVKVFSGGEFLFQFGGFGSAEGQLHGPTGVAVDPADNILVADWGNARIQVFNCVGAFKGVLAPSVHPLSCPQGLALSPEGTRLVVADTGNHCCKVYSYHQH
ncbi:uncharacterized protein LOC142906039 [Petromyzon marinus]|uniref:uncharacterized protein LOC142906039 n=1 Tax=Petromyzon marinus TaxID=7757 RepID=UPI003F705604